MKRKALWWVAGTMVAAAAVASIWSRPSAAFDHKDTSETEAVAGADITDVFAFPRPEGGGDAGFTPTTHLIVMMTTTPGATTTTRFDPTIRYILRLRPVFDPEALTAIPFFGADIACTFDDGTPQKVACNANGVFGEAPVGEQADAGSPDDPLRVFAGLRSDPAFADVSAFMETVKTKQNKFKSPGVNAFQGQNVMALVVDVDLTAVLPPGPPGPLPQIAVTAETARN